MLSALLRPSSRRLSRPFLAALEYVHVPRSRAAPSVRCLSSSVIEGGDPSSGQSLSGKEKHESHWRSIAWEKKILGALKAYKEINGDLLVTRSFVVPTGDIRWPREARGYRLGKGVNYLRTLAAKQELPPRLDVQLKEMGFVYNVFPYQWHEIIMPALRCYHKVHGHTDIPREFVVPSGDDAWPRQTWDWKLGITVNAITHYQAYFQQVRESDEELKELKFCYKMSLVERDWREKILPALGIFRQENHHCLVDQSFKVPSESPWPNETWGLSLGKTVNQIRVGERYAEQVRRDKDELIHLGFSWDFHGSNWSDRLLPALKVCEAEYGDFRLSQQFAVPQRDPWPRNVWGMMLGKQLYMMWYGGYYFRYIGRDVDPLQALGFRFELSDPAWKKKVVPLLDTYAEVFGDKAVPPDFVIPSESPWPKMVWGVHLGIFVDRNRKYLTN